MKKHCFWALGFWIWTILRNKSKLHESTLFLLFVHSKKLDRIQPNNVRKGRESLQVKVLFQNWAKVLTHPKYWLDRARDARQEFLLQSDCSRHRLHLGSLGSHECAWDQCNPIVVSAPKGLELTRSQQRFHFEWLHFSTHEFWCHNELNNFESSKASHPLFMQELQSWWRA